MYPNPITDRSASLDALAQRRAAQFQNDNGASQPGTQPTSGGTTPPAPSNPGWSDPGSGYITGANADRSAPAPFSGPTAPSPQMRMLDDVAGEFKRGYDAPGGGVLTGAALAARDALGAGVAHVVDSASDLGSIGISPVRAFFTGDVASPSTPPNAGVDASLRTPRDASVPVANRSDPASYGMNNRSTDYTPPSSSVFSAMGRDGTTLPAGITRNGSSYSGVGAPDPNAPPPMTTEQANAYYGAQLDGMRAREQAEDARVAGAKAGYAARMAAAPTPGEIQRAESSARVAGFLANNGAYGGATIRGINAERAAAQGRAADLAGEATRLRGLAAAAAAVPGASSAPSYIDDFVKTQGAQTAAQDAALRQGGTATAAQAAQLDLAARKQLADLDAQIASESDPKKLQVLQQKRAALTGKGSEKNFAVIDVDTGQTTKDMMGNDVPVYKKGLVNTQTGELISGAGASKDDIAKLRSASVEDAHRQAKLAIARGASLEAANTVLKQAGQPPLDGETAGMLSRLFSAVTGGGKAAPTAGAATSPTPSAGGDVAATDPRRSALGGALRSSPRDPALRAQYDAAFGAGAADQAFPIR